MLWDRGETGDSSKKRANNKKVNGHPSQWGPLQILCYTVLHILGRLATTVCPGNEIIASLFVSLLCRHLWDILSVIFADSE